MGTLPSSSSFVVNCCCCCCCQTGPNPHPTNYSTRYSSMKVDKFLSFDAVRLIKIEDWRLGVIHRTIQGAIFFFLVILPLIADPLSFYHSNTPTPVVSFWANQGTLYKQQYTDTSTPSLYCDDRNRPLNAVGTVARAKERTQGNNKFDSDTSCTTSLERVPTDSERYWFEADMTSTPVSYAEMFDKSDASMFFMTFFMQTVAKDVTCSPGYSCSSYGPSFNYTQLNPDRCQCISKTSHFTPGVEAMELGMKVSTTDGDPRIDIHSDDWFASYMPKRLIEKDSVTGDESTVQEYAWNENPESTIAKWLEAAGVKLDDPNDALCKSTYLNNGGPQHYRVAGLNIELDFRYSGVLAPNHRNGKVYANKRTQSYNTPPDASQCPNKVVNRDCLLKQYNDVPDIGVDIIVTVQKNAWGTRGVQVTYPSATETQDRYRRGIIVRYTQSGTYSVFDHWSLINRITSIVVFLGVATVFTSMIAFNCLKESSVYKVSYRTPLSVEREYSKFAGQAVILARLFEHVGGGTGKVTQENLAIMLKGKDNMTTQDANNLAEQLIRGSDEHQEVDPNDPEQLNTGYGLVYADGTVPYDATQEGYQSMIANGQMRKGYLSFTEFVDGVTEDTISLTQLREALRLDDNDFDDVEAQGSGQPRLKRAATQRPKGNRLPHPLSHIEVCIDKRDGRTYYKDHQSRTTSWVNPMGNKSRTSKTAVASL